MFNGEWGQQCCMKDTRSVDERHEVYEEQRGCYERHAERVRRATLLHEEQRGCYEGHGMGERLFAFNR